MLTQAERRLKDALRKKKERQMAKLFASEKEKGTNFMIYLGFLCTVHFISKNLLIPVMYVYCMLQINSLKRNID